jgi:hypothetical protein
MAGAEEAVSAGDGETHRVLQAIADSLGLSFLRFDPP